MLEVSLFAPLQYRGLKWPGNRTRYSAGELRTDFSVLQSAPEMRGGHRAKSVCGIEINIDRGSCDCGAAGRHSLDYILSPILND